MKQTSTKLKKSIIPLLLQLMLVVGFAKQGVAQSTSVFFEGMGTTIPTTSNNTISNWESSGFFDMTALTMSGTATITNETPVNQDSPNNVRFMAGQTFTISNINTTDFTKLSLSFNVKKNITNTTTSQNFTVAYSTNGTDFTVAPYEELPSASDATWHSRSVTIPDGTVAIRFTNTTATTDFTSFNLDNIQLAGQSTVTSAPPTISGFSPAVGGLGTEITITGTNLQIVTKAYIVLEDNSDFYELTIPEQVREGTQLKAVVTNGKTNSYKIHIVSAYGRVISNDLFELKAPTIDGMTPAAGLVGSTVKLTGTFLGTTTQATFGGGIATTNFTVQNDSDTNSEIWVVVPAGAQTGQIRLVTSLGTATSPAPFEVYRPVITSLSTTSGMIGSTVQLNGTRLNSGGTPTVTFSNGVTAAVSSATQTAVVVTVPAGAVTGPITLTTTEGTATSAVFTVNQPTMVVTGALEPFTSEVDKASASQSYTVSGNHLIEGVRITAPAHFQVSLSADKDFNTYIDVPLTTSSTGTLSATTIYVRLLASSHGSLSGNITHESAYAPAVTLAVQGEATPPEQGTLPVELVSFTYAQQHNGVLLKWRTATEKDNSHFEIEMTYNPAQGFNKIARVDSKTVNASEFTNYHYLHTYKSTGGTRYYRLKQVDLDGTFTYSNIIAVEAAPQAISAVAVAPNPVERNSTIYITALKDGKAFIRLHNPDGKQIHNGVVQLHQGQNEVQMPVYDKLLSGVYILTVELDNTVQKVKVLKQ